MSSERSGRIKRLIGGVYSATAKRVYEPVVVQRAFPLFGGDLHGTALEQGRRAVAQAGGEPILDLPVGTGFFTTKIAGAHQGLLVGADIAWGMVAKTAEVAAAADLDGLFPLQCDAHHLPFETGSFAAVLCHNGLQVMPGLTRSLAELARVLAPGGMLYVTVLTLPVGRLLPHRSAGHLPTVLRSGLDVAEAISEAGLFITTLDRERFATAIEAVKPAG